jgi:DNA-binding NarL/FixJ family response regulator
LVGNQVEKRILADKSSPSADFDQSLIPMATDERASRKAMETPNGAEHFTAAIIHKSQLYSDCLRLSMNEVVGARVVTFSRVESWLEHRAAQTAALVLICVAGLNRQEEAQQLNLLLSSSESVPPVVVMGDSEAPADIIDVLNRGARGYIPSSLSLDLTIRALHLVLAGGVFIPASSLLASQCSPSAAHHTNLGMFTARQLAVIDSIRKGKPNKTIAYELNMCESTVKVHVRNIMKKLQAKNRTHIAFIANQILKGS